MISEPPLLLCSFDREVCLGAFCIRHRHSINRGIMVSDRTLRSVTARAPYSYDDAPYFLNAIASIVDDCPTDREDLETASVFLSMKLRDKSETDEDLVHEVQLTEENRILDESLSVVNSRRIDALRLGPIQVHAPYIDGPPALATLQTWITKLAENILRLQLLNRVDDEVVLDSNRARYRAIGVVLGLALVLRLPVALIIDNGLLEYLITPVNRDILEKEYSWEIMALGFQRIVDAEIVIEFEKRFPGIFTPSSWRLTRRLI